MRIARDSRWAPLVAAVPSVAAVVAYGRWRFHYFADDAFISLREASFLAHGRGLTFNPGEHIEAATNLLWVLILAIPSALELDLVSAARLLGELSAGAAMAIGAVAIWRMAGGWLALAFSLWLLAEPTWACWAGAGLEGPLVALLGMVFVLAEARPRVGGAALALAFVARPDALLAGAGLAFERRRWIPLAIASITVATVSLFRRIWFGQWVPNSAAAKLGLTEAVIRRGLAYCEGFCGHGVMPGVLLLAVWGGWAQRDVPAVRRALAWLVAQLAFMIAVGGDGLAQYRFGLPILPALGFLAAIGANEALRPLSPGARAAAAIALGGILAMPGFLLVNRESTSHEIQRDVELPRWTAAGRWLAQNTPGDQWVAASPIGAVGYYADRPILDILGLADRHIASVPVALGEGRAGHERHDGKYVLDRAPAIILLGNVDVSWKPEAAAAVSWEQDIAADPRLLRDYAPCSAELAPDQFLDFWHRRALGACPGSSLELSDALEKWRAATSRPGRPPDRSPASR